MMVRPIFCDATGKSYADEKSWHVYPNRLKTIMINNEPKYVLGMMSK